MACKHENTDVQELSRYEGMEYPPSLVTDTWLVCLDCNKKIEKRFPSAVNIQFKGKGMNDRRYLRGETSRPD
jgi:hypothetical protein